MTTSTNGNEPAHHLTEEQLRRMFRRVCRDPWFSERPMCPVSRDAISWPDELTWPICDSDCHPAEIIASMVALALVGPGVFEPARGEVFIEDVLASTVTPANVKWCW